MQTRQELTDQLDSLYAESGAAMLDNKKFDFSKITTLENQLRQIDDGESERVRRERTKEDQERKAEARRAVRAITKLESDRALAWSDLQVACGTMRDAIARVVQNSEVERDIWAAMQEQVPPALGSHDTYSRLGLRIANELSKAPGCKTRIGGAVQWSGIGGLLANDDDWRAAELRLMDIPIRALMDTLDIEDAE